MRDDFDRIADALTREEHDAISLLDYLDFELTALGAELILIADLELIVLSTLLTNGDESAVLNIIYIIVHRNSSED